MLLIAHVYCQSPISSQDYGRQHWDDLLHLPIACALSAYYRDCVIRYEKGSKILTNENRDVHMQPLDDPKYNVVCPIALLVALALRHMLVEGSTATDIFTRACARTDRRIIWKFPYLPVCPAFCGAEDHGSARCLLDKAAVTSQALDLLKQMGLVSNLLSRVHVHALREGHARDVAHLEVKSGQGLVTNEVRLSLGHSERTYRNGTTQKYIGDPTQLLYNDRVQTQWVDPLAPQFGIGTTSAHALVKAPVSATEIEAWHARHEPTEASLTLKNPNRYARDSIRRERLQNYLTTAEPESPTKGKAKAKLFRQKSTDYVPLQKKVLIFPAKKESIVKVWVPIRCHLGGCTTSIIFKDAWEFKRHAVGAHNDTVDQATELRQNLYRSLTSSGRSPRTEQVPKASRPKKRRL